MLDTGDTAPDFTVPMATPEHAAGAGEYTAEDVESFTLSAALADGPVVLAFFPGAFSRTCTEELCQLRDWRADLADLDARVYGVSADTPWSLLAFADEYDIDYPLLSAFNSDVIVDYGMELDAGVLSGLAGRGVFVVDTDRVVRYGWVGANPRELPALDEVRAALAEL